VCGILVSFLLHLVLFGIFGRVLVDRRSVFLGFFLRKATAIRFRLCLSIDLSSGVIPEAFLIWLSFLWTTEGVPLSFGWSLSFLAALL